MKKLLIALMLFGFTLSAQADVRISLLPTKEEMNTVTTIGFKLLNENRIPYKMTFSVKKHKNPNACTYYVDNEIVVTTSLIKAMDTEDELAAVVAHEISHGVDYRQGIFKGYFSYLSSTFSSKKDEYKADKRAVDYLVKAGYNPVALIVALNKIAPQHRYDWHLSHPLTTRRMAEIYEYIYVKYPQYLVDNKYKDNLLYQNFLLTSRENRAKLEKKIKENSKRKVNYL